MQTNQPKQDAIIHLRVEAERKNRWVKLSQKAGQKLTDWVIDAVEESVAMRRDKNHGQTQGAIDPPAI